MLYGMLVNVGIETYIDKKTCQNLTNKTYKCWHRNIYIFKIGSFGSLKGVFKNLRKP